MKAKIIQFQVVPHDGGSGQTIYVLTEDGRLYSSNSMVGDGSWMLVT